MAVTIHIYLDKRSSKRGDEAPLKIGINKQALLRTSILV